MCVSIPDTQGWRDPLELYLFVPLYTYIWETIYVNAISNEAITTLLLKQCSSTLIDQFCVSKIWIWIHKLLRIHLKAAAKWMCLCSGKLNQMKTHWSQCSIGHLPATWLVHVILPEKPGGNNFEKCSLITNVSSMNIKLEMLSTLLFMLTVT